MAESITTSAISYEDIITYAIRQQVNTYGSNCISSYYSKFVFTDTLPTGLTPIEMTIYVENERKVTGKITSLTSTSSSVEFDFAGTAFDVGSMSFNPKTRVFKFEASTYFLKNVLKMNGEYIDIEIQAQLTDETVTKLVNSATWLINTAEVTSNEVITPVVTKQSFTVRYYRDGINGEWEEVFVQAVKEGSKLQISSEATQSATLNNCAGFTGWYFADPKEAGATKATDDAIKITENVNLYGRNYCEVTYKTATNEFLQKLEDTSLYLDQSLTQQATFESTYPAAEIVYLGSNIAISGSSTLFYIEGDRTRRTKSCNGAYVNDPQATGVKATNLIIIESNCVLYKTWSGSTFDGVIASR